MTFKEVKKALQAIGCALRKTEGDYRVCPYGVTEEGAYYTCGLSQDDLQDALNTGILIVQSLQNRLEK